VLLLSRRQPRLHPLPGRLLLFTLTRISLLLSVSMPPNPSLARATNHLKLFLPHRVSESPRKNSPRQHLPRAMR
jgi:hypothetical protein